MSDTFSIGCKDCLVHLWIGQGWRSKWESYRHYSTEESREAFAKFLFEHKKHHLIFDENADESTFYEYQELEYIDSKSEFRVMEDHEDSL